MSASTSTHASSRASAGTRERPLVAHVVYRFDTGGLENGVVNLINHLPAERYDHVVIALTDVTDFRRRVVRDRTRFHALGKPPGHGFAIYRDLYRLFRTLRPTIVHTRNLAASEAQLPATLAGVPIRVHGEHGWDVQDVAGGKPLHRLQRRFLRPFVHRHVALSGEIRRYLEQNIGVAPGDIAQICNGVDTNRFVPRSSAARVAIDPSFAAPDAIVVGTVGRLSPVKHQRLLVDAFAAAVERLRADAPQVADRLRLALVGDGPDRAALDARVAASGVADRIALLGNRDDVPRVMADFDVFVLPSLAEGISNTILEAMACGVPVVATRVGGNAELVADGATGVLVASDDVAAMADAIAAYARDPRRVERDGRAARERAVAQFSIDAMVSRYADLYDALLATRGRGATRRNPDLAPDRPAASH